ncbi:hypothetical protein [Neorhizobium galegae]|jgi:hypothetical protein|uniref:Uncharacterized protein n=2 Tax=Neorhizobium galegae TaxID=399 RepID=A0A068SZ85_NEOGA|nr:hypothetical protein [Neorhizobium galegae]KAB1083560.1 hypothetical protein F4V91_29160 [Neorhizobium galegae]MCQ1852815.1 hypothetical protein [Neorhizobium galegae]CDN51136.1 Hypothetical protein RG540_PA04580 [Neorhizobium galegae bv. orientalis str. HAMBI 540]CDZ49247.1 Hypothetical protein NGAL_HAMBI2427_30520 [Neorhizobium galegae bv. orientalis]
MFVLNKPRSSGPYPDRDIGCQEALEQPFLELAKGLTPDNVAETAGGNLPPVLKGLALRAENVGWTVEEAEVAISELAQNLLDEMSLM